jgi:hypothetical protein
MDPLRLTLEEPPGWNSEQEDLFVLADERHFHVLAG